VVAVAQLVESRIVIPVVVGSSPISHPKNSAVKIKGYALLARSLFFFGRAYGDCDDRWDRIYRDHIRSCRRGDQLSTAKRYYEAIGQAVYASQIFEFIFVMTVRLALKQEDVTTLEDLVPLSFKKSFKTPVTSLLRDVGTATHLSDDLVARIEDWVQRRHKIIHRKLLEDGWPENHEAAKLAFAIAECKQVSKDGAILAAELCDVLLPWYEKFEKANEISPLIRRLRETLRTPGL
jgi:hypothetical protein